MSNTDKSGNSNVLVGLGVGIVLGALAASLLSPKSGKDMRQTLGAQAQKVGRKIKKNTDDVAEKAEEVAEKAKKPS